MWLFATTGVLTAPFSQNSKFDSASMTVYPSSRSATTERDFMYCSRLSRLGSSEMWKMQRLSSPRAFMCARKSGRNVRRKTGSSPSEAGVSQPKMRRYSPSTVAIILGAKAAPHCVNRWLISNFFLKQTKPIHSKYLPNLPHSFQEFL